jgi:hypothetical protein
MPAKIDHETWKVGPVGQGSRLSSETLPDVFANTGDAEPHIQALAAKFPMRGHTDGDEPYFWARDSDADIVHRWMVFIT